MCGLTLDCGDLSTVLQSTETPFSKKKKRKEKEQKETRIFFLQTKPPSFLGRRKIHITIFHIITRGENSLNQKSYVYAYIHLATIYYSIVVIILNIKY